MRIEIGQVVTQIISFLVMLWVMKRYAWKPFLNLLDGRKEKIRADLEAIEAEKAAVEKAAQEYSDKIKSIEAYALVKTQEGIDKGKQMAYEIQKEAQLRTRAMLTKHEEDLQNEITKAKKELKNELVNITMAATEKILKSKLNKEDQEKLLADFVEQTGAN